MKGETEGVVVRRVGGMVKGLKGGSWLCRRDMEGV